MSDVAWVSGQLGEDEDYKFENENNQGVWS